MKRIGLIIATASLALAACGNTEGVESGADDAPRTHYTFWQETPNGRVLCVWAKSGHGGGLSCDWSGVAS